MVGLTCSRTRGVAFPRGRVAALAAVLILGILGMHALAQHCASPGRGADVAATTLETSSHLAAAMGAKTHVHSKTTQSLGSAHTAPVRGEDPSASAVVALCAAMLLLAGTALVLLLGFRRGWPRGWQVRRALSSAARQVSAPSGTGPPYVVAFAVIRC